jgi:hypothetical protein
MGERDKQGFVGEDESGKWGSEFDAWPGGNGYSNLGEVTP